ncbi:uncharacterized protein LOC108951036 isoform X2 [Ciona intestinalis]
MNYKGMDILWQHIDQLYQQEQSTMLLFRTRLTKAHIHLNPFSKMNLKLAKDIFSLQVAKNLGSVQGAEGTAMFVSHVTEWFEIINAKANHAIYSMSDSRILKLKSFIEFLLDWKVRLFDL